MLCVYIYYIYIYYVGEMYTPFPWLVWNKAGTLFFGHQERLTGIGRPGGWLVKYLPQEVLRSTWMYMYILYIYICIIYVDQGNAMQCNAMYLWVFPKVGVPWNHPKFDYFNIEIHEFRAFPGENTYPWFDDLWSEKADDFASPFREYFQWARFEWFFQDAALQVKLWNWFEKNPSSVPPFQHWRLWVGGETRTMISLGVHKSHETLHRWSENVGYPIGFP